MADQIQDIYQEQELLPEATVKKYLTVRTEGKREATVANYATVQYEPKRFL